MKEEEEEEEEVEEDEERVGRNVRTLRANKLRMCRGHYFSFLGVTLTPPAIIILRTRPTHGSGLSPDSLVIRPVLGPEYLLSDAGQAAETGLSLRCSAVHQDLQLLIMESTLWGTHRDTGSTARVRYSDTQTDASLKSHTKQIEAHKHTVVVVVVELGVASVLQWGCSLCRCV